MGSPGSGRSLPPTGHPGWQYRFDRGEGAYLEGDTLHLSSGLVLPLADDFAYPNYPSDPFPLRRDDAVCLNSEGEVSSVEIWIPY